MPIRLTCPSCSATLSVKDEYAGRAVKCPKCGGVIPAAQPATPAASATPVAPPPATSDSPPPPPEPAAEKSPFEELDEPAKPAKTGGKITGRPVSRAKGDDEDEDDDRPRRKGRDEDDERPRRKRDEDEDDDARSKDRDEDDRPRRKRRDDDEDGPPRGRRGQPQGGKANTPLILAIVGFFLLACCGGVGYGVYWFVSKAKETVDAVKEGLEKSNRRVNQGNYTNLRVGTNTRLQVDQTLGDGKIATAEDLKLAFGTDQKKIGAWTPKVDQGRAVIWRNNDDFIVAAFHPGADAAARLQAKEWRPKSGGYAAEGELDDAVFLEKYPPGKKDGGPATEIAPDRLVTEFLDNPAAARTKYAGKVLVVESQLTGITQIGDEVIAILDKIPATGNHLHCSLRADAVAGIFAASYGQKVKIRGRCGDEAKLSDCTVESLGTDESVRVAATALVADYRNESAADAKYRDKQLTVSNLIVEKVGPSGDVTATAPGKAGGMKVLVKLDPVMFKRFNLKPGTTFKAKGTCDGILDGVIVLAQAWVAP